MMKESYPEQGSSTGDSARRFIKRISVLDFILRVAALVGTFASAIVTATSGQTLPLFTQLFRFQAQYDDLPTLKLLVFANSLVSAYLVLSLPLSIFHINATAARSSRVILVTFDTVMLAFLTALASAATTIVHLARNGNQQANWFSICRQFNKFCDQLAGSTILSLIAAAAFLLLTMLSAIGISTRRL